MVSVEQYLATSYSPECDYVDGEVIELNVGERDHSETKFEIAAYLMERRKQLGIYVAINWTMQVSPTRFRVPDVTVVLGPRPNAQILRVPTFICVEVLSPDDRASDTQEKILDYLNFGVKYVWVVDPRLQRGWIVTKEGTVEAQDDILTTMNPEIAVPLSEIYARIEDL
jgi:Uma2 family endonuclease